MDRRRMQQIINDKQALDALREQGIDISMDDHRSPSQILASISQRAVEMTIQLPETERNGEKL